MNKFEHIQDAILMGLRYKEAYEKLLWEKNILISCLCSGRTDVIGIDDHEGQTTWGIDDGKIVEGYACYSPYSAVQWMLTEMKKWEDENE